MIVLIQRASFSRKFLDSRFYVVARGRLFGASLAAFSVKRSEE